MRAEYTAVPTDEPVNINIAVIPVTGDINAFCLFKLLQKKSHLQKQVLNFKEVFSVTDFVKNLQIALLKKATPHHLELFTFSKQSTHGNTDPFRLWVYDAGLTDAARFSETFQCKRDNRFPLGIAQLRASTFKENTIVAHAKWMTLFLLTMGAIIAFFGTSLFNRLSDPIDERLIRLANETKYNETQNITHPPIDLAKIRMGADLLVDVIYGIAVLLTCCLSAFLLSRIDLSRRFPSDELKKIMRELNERYERESSLHHLNNPIIDRIAELLLASKDARKILTEVIDESLEIKNKEIKNKPQAPAP